MHNLTIYVILIDVILIVMRMLSGSEQIGKNILP